MPFVLPFFIVKDKMKNNKCPFRLSFPFVLFPILSLPFLLLLKPYGLCCQSNGFGWGFSTRLSNQYPIVPWLAQLAPIGQVSLKGPPWLHDATRNRCDSTATCYARRTELPCYCRLNNMLNLFLCHIFVFVFHKTFSQVVGANVLQSGSRCCYILFIAGHKI